MKVITTSILLAIVSAVSIVFAKDITVSPGDSLSKARDEAKAGDHIILKGGVYRLRETLVLGRENSGVTWMAAPGEKPVLSGGVPVMGWTPDADGVWKTALAWDGKLRQLILNGRPAILAEGPTVKPLGWRGEFVIKGDEPWAADGAGKAPDGYAFKKSDLSVLAQSNPADFEFRQPRTWTIQYLCFRDLLNH